MRWGFRESVFQSAIGLIIYEKHGNYQLNQHQVHTRMLNLVLLASQQSS